LQGLKRIKNTFIDIQPSFLFEVIEKEQKQAHFREFESFYLASVSKEGFFKPS